MIRKISLSIALLFGIVNIASATNTFVDTNAALKALAGGVTTTAYRTGYYSTGDGGAAIYAWNGASSCTDDGGSCIQPNAGAGRWILNADGAQSIKVFGAKCDGSTNDATAINNALKAVEAVFVPAKSTCNYNIASASDGIKLGSTSCSAGHCGTAHLFGQSRESSVLQFNRSYTPSFDFVTTHQFINIVVNANIATVTTQWSHQLKPAQTVTISGSATAGLNGTKTIRSIGSSPAQTDSYNSFSFTTTGVANGTYTDPTHITGQSGINVAAIYTAARDQNVSNDFTVFELDHLTLKASGTSIPLTWIDLTGSRSSSVHHITIDTTIDNGSFNDNMEVMVRCTDRSPTDFNKVSDCFFAHVYDIDANGPVTFGLQAPSQDGNASRGIFESWLGQGEALGDFNGNQQSNNLTLIQWYMSADGSPLSIDFTGGAPGQTFVNNLSIEGATTLTYDASNQVAFSDGTSDDGGGFPNVRLANPLVAGLSACPSVAKLGQITTVSDSNSVVFNAALAGGGANTVVALCTPGGWKVH